MTSRKIDPQEHWPCAESGPEDGLDPRLQNRAGSRPAGDRKLRQLCSQVARTLNAVLAGECGDDLLRDLVVESVTPAPSSARLLVTVALAPAAPAHDPALLSEHLERARGLLRVAVAGAVRRRRAPDLLFHIRKRS
jgi:ribosome-binding factor A